MNGDTFRILAGQDGTEVRINGALVETLGFGDYYETQLESAAVIETSAPSLVMQYSNGDQFDPERTANGDPFMMLIPPPSSSWIGTRLRPQMKDSRSTW